MSLDTIFGLPIHPLVVHAVVVLLPLACLGAIAIAARFSWRERFGTLVLVVAVAASVAVPVATQSGESLAGRVGEPERHVELGEMLKFYVIPWLLLLIAMVWFSRSSIAARNYPTQRWFLALRIAVILMSVASIVGVVLAGHSGSQAVWTEIIENTTPNSR